MISLLSTSDEKDINRTVATVAKVVCDDIMQILSIGNHAEIHPKRLHTEFP